MPDAILAESNETVVVEGNHYFPPNSINKNFFRASETHTIFPWKGVGGYYDILVNGEVNRDAAWYYLQPTKAAKHTRNYIAFWKGVQVIE